MAGSRVPGPLGADADAAELDPGTLARVQTPSPGVVGGRRNFIDPADPEMRQHLALIASLKEGRYSLQSLQGMRRAHAELLNEVVSQFGDACKAAQLQRLTLKTLDDLIAVTSWTAQWPQRADDAITQFEALLDRAVRGGAGAPGLVEVKEAMKRAINLEHDREVTGQGDGSSRLGPRVMRALDFGFDQHRRELIDLAERGLRDPEGVSDQQVLEAVSTLLGDERQRELLGGPERLEEANQALQRASELWLLKRTVDLQRAYAAGGETSIAQAQKAYEAAKRVARERGLAVSEADVRTGLPSTRP